MRGAVEQDLSARRREELAAKVAFLSRPEAYPDERPERVEVVETSASFLFLTRARVRKLKKPIRREMLDLSSLARRLENAREELRLNRRLAPGVYLWLEPVVRRAGELHLGGEGRVVDWLVVMRRLPAERMLDRVIAAGEVEEEDLVRVGRLLAAFHLDAPVAPVEPEEHRRRLIEGVRLDLAVLSRPELGAPDEQARALASRLLEELEEEPERFRERVREGRILDGHGDLRPEHVCLLRPEPVVIDCLEFSAELRQQDPADELALLQLECERLGSEAGARILAAYRAAGAGDPPAGMVSFYRGYRALRRARLAIAHLDDPCLADPAKWRARCARYLELGERPS